MADSGKIFSTGSTKSAFRCRRYAFGSKCPAYTEDWGGEAPARAYVLNCHPVGSIAAALRALREDPAGTDAHVERGLARARQFSWRASTEAYLELYAAVAA